MAKELFVIDEMHEHTNGGIDGGYLTDYHYFVLKEDKIEHRFSYSAPDCDSFSDDFGYEPERISTKEDALELIELKLTETSLKLKELEELKQLVQAKKFTSVADYTDFDENDDEDNEDEDD